MGGDIVQLQGEIDRLIRRRRPFDEIEDVIERAELTEDQKSALWLFAWARQPKRVLRRETERTLQVVAGG